METRLTSKYCITSRFSRVLMGENIGTFTNLIKKVKVAALNIKWHHVTRHVTPRNAKCSLKKGKKWVIWVNYNFLLL